MSYCTGKCKRYKALKSRYIGRYASGQKRCNFCEIFVNYDGLKCPCCNTQLRSAPRSRKDKESCLAQITIWGKLWWVNIPVEVFVDIMM